MTISYLDFSLKILTLALEIKIIWKSSLLNLVNQKPCKSNLQIENKLKINLQIKNKIVN